MSLLATICWASKRPVIIQSSSNRLPILEFSNFSGNSLVWMNSRGKGHFHARQLDRIESNRWIRGHKSVGQCRFWTSWPRSSHLNKSTGAVHWFHWLNWRCWNWSSNLNNWPLVHIQRTVSISWLIRWLGNAGTMPMDGSWWWTQYNRWWNEVIMIGGTAMKQIFSMKERKREREREREGNEQLQSIWWLNE